MAGSARRNYAQYCLRRRWVKAHDGPMPPRFPVLLVLVLFATPASPGERCVALDGGTLRCYGERIRIEGVQAPPLGEPGGEEARQRLERRIRSGEVVIARGNQDRFGRTRARVYVNGDRITQTDIGPRPAKRTRSSIAARK
jgi:nuclease-like protein